jgi:hypothetical protein
MIWDVCETVKIFVSEALGARFSWSSSLLFLSVVTYALLIYPSLPFLTFPTFNSSLPSISQKHL